MADEQTPEELAEWLRGWSPKTADSFVQLAEEFGVTGLDYTPESLAQVERLIDEHFTPQGRKRPAKKWHDLSGATAAYVAEVVLRNIGGTWDLNAEFGRGGIRLPRGTWIFPFDKARKRYEDGRGDDFVSYYSVLAADQQPAP